MSIQSSLEDYLSYLQGPQYQTIPLQLKAGKRHVVWMPEQRGDKIAKTPVKRQLIRTPCQE